MKEPIVFWIDLFCGAGGTSTGIHLANANAKVMACVNHDEVAIASHKANLPDCLHFTEDVRDMKVVRRLKTLVNKLRKEFPGCIINIWASLECTNYSKAKGGLPRDADSRTLAHALYEYIEQLQPDYIWIENVREFMAWGPLDKKGKPVSRKNGADYVKWCNHIQDMGYRYDYRLLNAANFGAYTSRERYFGQFAKSGLPISWPEETHAKEIPDEQGMFKSNKKKWKPVREVLDLANEGKSIFERKKPLSENTLKRIYAGLVKFVANGDDSFTKVYNSGNDMQRVKSLEEPIGSLTTQNSHAKVKCVFLKKYYSGDPAGKCITINGPSGTIKCKDSHAIVQSIFLSTYYGNGGNHSIDGAAPTVTTRDRISKVEAQFMFQSNGGPESAKVWGIDGPNRTITTSPNQSLVNPEFLVQYQGKSDVQGTNKPLGSILTKDKFAKVQPQFFTNNYSGGGQNSSIENPSPSITTVPKQNLTSCEFMDQQYGNSKPKDVDSPAGAITANPKFAIVQAKPWLMDTNFNNIGSSIEDPARVITANRKWHYLMNPQFNSKGAAADQPAPTLIARMDKKPLYLVEAQTGEMAIVVYEDDCDTMVKIKKFMAAYGIVDIKMRMLLIKELLRIQGFPRDYQLKGTKTEQKKFIGNSVVPLIAQRLVESNYQVILKSSIAA